MRKTTGFGVPDTADPHHFKVTIDRKEVIIQEWLGVQANPHFNPLIPRALMPRARWNLLAGPLKNEFNQRLRSHDLRTSTWRAGENMVDRLLGKELCLLVWAVESMDMEAIPLAVRNWLTLRPEERWWLYGMALAHGRWRRALPVIMGED